MVDPSTHHKFYFNTKIYKEMNKWKTPDETPPTFIGREIECRGAVTLNW